MSVVKAPVDKQLSKDSDGSAILGWFRTLLEFDKAAQHHWPSDTPEWGVVSLGSLDVSWRAATISPTDLTSDAGSCLIAMSTNMDLSLWLPTKNFLKGQWIRTQDVTSTLTAIPISPHLSDPSEEHKAYMHTLQAQVQCISWSGPANFSLSPQPLIDGSLLALGNRAGSVIFMRFDGDKTVKHMKTVRISENWVAHVSWTKWNPSSAGCCQAHIACGISDGSIILIKICQTIEHLSSSSDFGPRYHIQADFEAVDLKPSVADERAITALTCFETANGKQMLCFAKPGTLGLWQLPTPATGPEAESWNLRLRTQKLTAGSSSLSPVSGIQYVKARDVLLVSLSDGSYHVVHNVSSEPSLSTDTMDVDGAPTPLLTSEKVSSRSRAVFLKVEDTTLGHTDVNSTSGVTTFDGSSTVVWLHEASRPTDFSYKHDAKHNSMLVVAQLWESSSKEQVVQEITETFEGAITGHSPENILRRIFVQLRRPSRFEELSTAVLGLLPVNAPEDVSGMIIPAWSGKMDDNARQGFRRSLATHLYGWNSLHSLRLRLALADFCWKMAKSDDVRNEFGNVAQKLLNAISHRVLRTLVRHMRAAASEITVQDTPFMLRVVIQCVLPGSPPDLSAEADELAALLKTRNPASGGSQPLSEKCPACHAEIKLENIIEAVCPKGHVWKRCSITSFLLATPAVRTCVGCTRKALLPSSQMPDFVVPSTATPEYARSWIVEELLEASTRCLFCGNRFVRVL